MSNFGSLFSASGGNNLIDDVNPIFVQVASFSAALGSASGVANIYGMHTLQVVLPTPLQPPIMVTARRTGYGQVLHPSCALDYDSSGRVYRLLFTSPHWGGGLSGGTMDFRIYSFANHATRPDTYGLETYADGNIVFASWGNHLRVRHVTEIAPIVSPGSSSQPPPIVVNHPSVPHAFYVMNTVDYFEFNTFITPGPGSPGADFFFTQIKEKLSICQTSSTRTELRFEHYFFQTDSNYTDNNEYYSSTPVGDQRLILTQPTYS